jgi:hypothetical protein
VKEWFYGLTVWPCNEWDNTDCPATARPNQTEKDDQKWLKMKS